MAEAQIQTESRPVIVLGATGHLGRAACAALMKAGYRVQGLARASGPNSRSTSYIMWHFGDLARMLTPADWGALLADCRAVVNLAGALQDGSRDRLEDVHVTAIAAMVEAAPRDCLLVHVSAPGVTATASTAFYRSKARGDAVIRTSGRPHVIVRPAVVVGPEAYGGTALLRALAAFPGAIPAVHARSQMQTVCIDDVSAAICDAVAGRIPPGSDLVLAETHPHSLADVLAAFRQWLGLTPAPVWEVPAGLARLASWLADLAGHLGWRSPLRSTALAVTADGVIAPAGRPCRTLTETLAAMPATVPDRWFARLYLLKPVAIVTLSLFWLASGLIGLLEREAAAALLTAAGFSMGAATAGVVAGAIADIALGALILHQGTARMACFGMIAVTAIYLASASIFTPGLWLEPLGPLVKALPAALLAVLTLAILPERG